jgi:hypothetical protein
MVQVSETTNPLQPNPTPRKNAFCKYPMHPTINAKSSPPVHLVVLRPIPAPNTAKQPVLLANMEVPRIAASPHLLAGEQSADDETDSSKDGEHRVMPRKAVEREEEARNAPRGGLGGDKRRVVRDLVDGLEDGGAAGPDGLTGDGGVPEAAVLQS